MGTSGQLLLVYYLTILSRSHFCCFRQRSSRKSGALAKYRLPQRPFTSDSGTPITTTQRHQLPGKLSISHHRTQDLTDMSLAAFCNDLGYPTRFLSYRTLRILSAAASPTNCQIDYQSWSQLDSHTCAF